MIKTKGKVEQKCYKQTSNPKTKIIHLTKPSLTNLHYQS